MKKALVVATIVGFITSFEMNDIHILQEMGYEVHIASNMDNCSNAKKLDYLLSTGVISHNIKFHRNPFCIGNIKAFKELRKLMDDANFDLLHCHTPVGGVLGRIAAYCAGIPKVIYTAHGFHFYDGAPLQNWLIFYPVEKILSKCTDVLITINREDYKRASNNFYARKTVYIPGVGVDTEKFATCSVDIKKKRQELGVRPEDFLLLSVGELNQNKNQKVIIDALGKLKSDNGIDNIMYLVVGTGDLQSEYERLIKEYGIEEHVKLLGYRTDIGELCKTVDCFVHPSIREGLGIAPLEAMASGLPIISSYIGGMRDYTKDGVSGCCVNPRSVTEMANAIKKMQSDKHFRMKCGENNLKTAKKFDICNTEEIMKGVYTKVKSHFINNI